MAGMGYNVGGKQFMSSVLAKAASPGGYGITTYHPGGNPYYTGPRTSLSHGARLAFSGALKQFQPGGAFGKGIEAMLERGRKKATATGQQALVSAGLSGTSMMAAPGQKYEEEIAAPTRLKAEETRVGRLSELYSMLAEMEQRSSDAEQARLFSTRPTPRLVSYGDLGGGGYNVPPVDFSIAGY